MANQNPLRVFRMQVHCPTEAVLKHLAISALARFHPSAVAERVETVFPNVKEIVLVDVALHKATVNVGTSGNGTVNQDGTDGDTRTAEIKPVTNLALVGTDIGLTTELAVNPPLLSGRDDEIHQLAELFIAELKALVSGGATNRVDSKQTPSLHLVFDE